MFNRTFIDASAKYPSRIDVHEHRAPTDASLALLQEMQEKALKSIIQSYPITAAGVHGSIIHMFNSFGKPELHISFAINNGGRKHVKVELDEHQTMAMEIHEYARYVVIEVAIEIAQQLLMDSTDVRRMIEGRYR